MRPLPLSSQRASQRASAPAPADGRAVTRGREGADSLAARSWNTIAVDAQPDSTRSNASISRRSPVFAARRDDARREPASVRRRHPVGCVMGAFAAAPATARFMDKRGALVAPREAKGPSAVESLRFARNDGRIPREKIFRGRASPAHAPQVFAGLHEAPRYGVQPLPLSRRFGSRLLSQRRVFVGRADRMRIVHDRDRICRTRAELSGGLFGMRLLSCAGEAHYLLSQETFSK